MLLIQSHLLAKRGRSVETMKYHSALFFIPFLLSSVLAVDKTCYFPDGTVSPEDVPCNPNDDFSPCCGHQADGTSAFCLSNGLCMGNFKLSRGSCTDKGWSNINCAQQCQTRKSHTSRNLAVFPLPEWNRDMSTNRAILNIFFFKKGKDP